LKRGLSIPKFAHSTPPLKPELVAKETSNKKEQQKEEIHTHSDDNGNGGGKYQTFLDEILGVAIYVDYKIKKLMEREIDHLRAMQEKLCCALLEKGKVAEELNTENKNLRKQLQEVTMERDILRKKLEYEREYARIISAIDGE
jgi:predicted RNase H-like nuclease (RuvC/YqgF family)